MRACSQTKSEHTRQQVAAIRCDDTSQRQIASCVWRNVCENLCLRNRILPLQQVAKKSNQTEFVRLVVATKFCCRDRDFYRNSLIYKKQFVAAATCRQVCTDLFRTTPPPLIGALLVINLCWVLAKRRG